MIKIADGQLVDFEYLNKRGLVGKVAITLDGVRQDLDRLESVLTGASGMVNLSSLDKNGNLYLDENGDVAKDTYHGHVVVSILNEVTE